MKTTFALTALLMWSTSSFAQVEQDDMYFNKKDRIKLIKEATAAEPAIDEALAKGEKPIRFDYTINKNSGSVDKSSTSPRDMNPEYIARSQSEMLAGEEESYFIENYQYATQKQLSTFSDNLNNWGNTPLYSSNYYSPSISGWNSPYYSPYNDPFLTGYSTNPWCNTGFQSGLSAAFSFNWGNNYGYGWGYPSIGLNLYYGNSMANLYWNGAYWGLNYSYGSYGYGGGYYPGYYPGGMGYSIAETKGPVYGKRGSRSKDVINPARYASSNSNRIVNSRNNNLTGSSSTTRTTSRASSSEYYTPQWRRVTQQSSPSSTTQNRVRSTTSDFFQNRSSSSNQRSSGSFSSPSRSSSFSAPSRSSSSGSSGSRSSSRSRGN